MADHIDVFISSTSTDLLEYREAVAKVILRLGMHPIDMADFNSSDRNALQLCYDKVYKAEVFIGIYAHRYGYAPDAEVTYTKKDGSVARGDGVTGITHAEYMWAKERDIPMLFFVVDEDADWKAKFIDEDRKPMKDFKNLIGKIHVWKTFTTPDDLASKVATGLAELIGKLKLDVGEPVLENFNDYRLERIAEWSQPRYQIDKRFVNLTLMIDQGEEAEKRWTVEERRFTELREVFTKRADDKAFVLLGAPGSGKSTLLRHLQMDLSKQALADGDDKVVSFFIQLNGYRRESGTPQAWLNSQWVERYPKLPKLDTLLSMGRMFLMLDAVNEMPHKSIADYHELVGLWRDLTRKLVELGNHVIYSCRTLDYGAVLSSKDLPVPQIEIRGMNDEQVQAFLNVYLPEQAERVWVELKGASHLDLFRTPFFLKLLCEQVESYQTVPKDRAALFTGFVRQVLKREIEGSNKLFLPNGLLNEKDHQKIARNTWRDSYDLPERGLLLNKIAFLAYTMQEKGLSTETAQVRIDYDAACDLIQHERDADILKAGVALNVLDEDARQEEVLFFHQLLQEFFAARQLAKNPKPELVASAWRADEVQPNLADVLENLPSNDSLPPLPQTGWEETILFAVEMSSSPEELIVSLIETNLPLAARCVYESGAHVSERLKSQIQDELISRKQNKDADLRARIAAGLALGYLGDPRFELCSGVYGKYLMPPLISIPTDIYPIGSDDGLYPNEQPSHLVQIDSFEIGRFPVTNAEYSLFIESGAYDDMQWWESEQARDWLKGEEIDAYKKQWTKHREVSKANLAQTTEEQLTEWHLRGLISDRELTNWQTIATISDESFQKILDNWKSSKQTEPRFWNDPGFCNPAQPVVGVSWYEAKAYCAWLSAQANLEFDLPTEVEWEAAARGKNGSIYPYGNEFKRNAGNTYEALIKRTTPVDTFPAGKTSCGGDDFSGNVYEWTNTAFRPYPYDKSDEREDTTVSDVRRVVRGASWLNNRIAARCSFRYQKYPFAWFNDHGFRVVCKR